MIIQYIAIFNTTMHQHTYVTDTYVRTSRVTTIIIHTGINFEHLILHKIIMQAMELFRFAPSFNTAND